MVIAASNDARCAAWPRRARAHWSWEALVIDPAHRDDESAVISRLRAAHRSLSCKRPSRQRAARSRQASDPRWAPTSPNTFSCAAVTRNRVRIATPDGPGTTNDGLITRRPPTRTPPLQLRADPPTSTGHNGRPRVRQKPGETGPPPQPAAQPPPSKTHPHSHTPSHALEH